MEVRDAPNAWTSIYKSMTSDKHKKTSSPILTIVHPPHSVLQIPKAVQILFTLFNWHFYNVYSTSGNVLSALPVFTCLILITSLWDQCFYPDVTDGETEAQSLSYSQIGWSWDLTLRNLVLQPTFFIPVLFCLSFFSMYNFPRSFSQIRSMLLLGLFLAKVPFPLSNCNVIKFKFSILQDWRKNRGDYCFDIQALPQEFPCSNKTKP